MKKGKQIRSNARKGISTQSKEGKRGQDGPTQRQNSNWGQVQWGHNMKENIKGVHAMKSFPQKKKFSRRDESGTIPKIFLNDGTPLEDKKLKGGVQHGQEVLADWYKACGFKKGLTRVRQETFGGGATRTGGRGKVVEKGVGKNAAL